MQIPVHSFVMQVSDLSGFYMVGTSFMEELNL